MRLALLSSGDTEMCKIREIVFFFVVVLLATPNIISAQEQDSGSRTLEEIIVTATKREVSSHDLPVSISALNTDDLKRIGAVGYTDSYKFAECSVNPD